MWRRQRESQEGGNDSGCPSSHFICRGRGITKADSHSSTQDLGRSDRNVQPGQGTKPAGPGLSLSHRGNEGYSRPEGAWAQLDPSGRRLRLRPTAPNCLPRTGPACLGTRAWAAEGPASYLSPGKAGGPSRNLNGARLLHGGGGRTGSSRRCCCSHFRRGCPNHCCCCHRERKQDTGRWGRKWSRRRKPRPLRFATTTAARTTAASLTPRAGRGRGQATRAGWGVLGESPVVPLKDDRSRAHEREGAQQTPTGVRLLCAKCGPARARFFTLSFTAVGLNCCRPSAVLIYWMLIGRFYCSMFVRKPLQVSLAICCGQGKAGCAG